MKPQAGRRPWRRAVSARPLSACGTTVPEDTRRRQCEPQPRHPAPPGACAPGSPRSQRVGLGGAAGPSLRPVLSRRRAHRPTLSRILPSGKLPLPCRPLGVVLSLPPAPCPEASCPSLGWYRLQPTQSPRLPACRPRALSLPGPCPLARSCACPGASLGSTAFGQYRSGKCKVSSPCCYHHGEFKTHTEVGRSFPNPHQEASMMELQRFQLTSLSRYFLYTLPDHL